MEWGNKVEIETRRRIKVCLWAYAYEIHSDSIVSDGEYDNECMLVDLKIKTLNKGMDKWFKSNFDPSTGMWIHSHPNKEYLEQLYNKYNKG